MNHTPWNAQSDCTDSKFQWIHLGLYSNSKDEVQVRWEDVGWMTSNDIRSIATGYPVSARIPQLHHCLVFFFTHLETFYCQRSGNCKGSGVLGLVNTSKLLKATKDIIQKDYTIKWKFAASTNAVDF